MLGEIIHGMLEERRENQMENQVAAVAFEGVFNEHVDEKRQKNLKRKYDRRHKRYERGGELELNRERRMWRRYDSDVCCIWNLSRRRRSDSRMELNAQLCEMRGVMRESEVRALQELESFMTEMAEKNDAILAANIADEIEYAFDFYWNQKYYEEERECEALEEYYAYLWDLAEEGWDAYLEEQAVKRAKEEEFHFSDLSDVELEALDEFLSA